MYWQSMLKNFILIGVRNQSLETTGLNELDHLAGVTGKMRTINLIVTAFCYIIWYGWEQIQESGFGRYSLWLLRSSNCSCSSYWEACHIKKGFLWTVALLLLNQVVVSEVDVRAVLVAVCHLLSWYVLWLEEKGLFRISPFHIWEKGGDWSLKEEN